MDKNIWMSILRALENKKMSQKKKTILIVGVILFVVIGLIGKYQYDKYQAEENLKLAEMSNIFTAIYPEDKEIWNGQYGSYSKAELKSFIKNPPKIEMNTASGLGLKVLAYNYYNDEDIDATKIQEMMESGQFHETYEYTVDFIDWANKNSGKITKYHIALSKASDSLGKGELDPETTTYEEYLSIINNSKGKKYIDEYFSSRRNNE